MEKCDERPRQGVLGGALLLTMLAPAGWADGGGDSSKNSGR